MNRLLRAFDLTIFMEGNTIVMPDITFEIVGGCSGLGYILVAFTLSVYLAFTSRVSLRTGAWLVAGFIGLALLSNWLRIASIMLFGYHYGSTHPLVHDHVWFGWVVFSVIFLPAMFVVLRRLPLPASAPAGARLGAARINLGRTIGLLVALLAFPCLLAVLDTLPRVTAEPPALLAPVDSSFYQPVENPTGWQPRFPGATLTSLKTYTGVREHAAGTVHFFQAHYVRQRDGAELIDDANDLAGEGWTRSGRTRADAPIGGTTRPVRETRIADGSGATMLVRFWYRIGDAHTESDTVAKVEQVLWKLRLRPDAALFAVAAACDESGCDSAREALDRFTATLERVEGQPH